MGVLIAYVLGILTAIQSKYHDGSSNHETSTSQQYKHSPNGPLAVVCIPPTPTKEEETEKKKYKRRKTILYRVKIGSLIVLFIYAGFTILIWCVMKGQLTEMQALRPQPIVAIDSNKLVGDLTFIGGYPMLNVSYSVTNYGTAIATSEGDGAVAFVSYDMEETWKMFKLWCWTGELTYPTHDEIVDSYGVTVMAPGMTIEGKQGAHNPQAVIARNGNKKIPFVVVEVCIKYQGQPGGKVHHTRYLYTGTTGIPPVEMNSDGWTYLKIESFHLDRAEAD
jgi:hypothetical protein